MALKVPIFSQRIVICGPVSFYSTMVEISEELRRFNIPCILPDLPQALPDGQPIDLARSQRILSLRHIRRIRDQRTRAILAVNLDKHGVIDYIGASMFAEIAVAIAHYKQVYLYQGIPTFYREELHAWNALPLDGRMDLVVNDYIDKNQLQMAQLELFDREAINVT